MSITEFLSGIPVNAVLRERITLLIEDKERLEKQVKELQTKYTELLKSSSDIKQQIAHQSASTEYIEHLGVLFKRQAKGGYALIPYCQRCKSPLSSIVDFGVNMFCSHCSFQASFQKGQLGSIHKELAEL